MDTENLKRIESIADCIVHNKTTAFEDLGLAKYTLGYLSPKDYRSLHLEAA